MQDLPRVHWGFTHQTEDMHGPHAQTNTFTHTVTADTHIHTHPNTVHRRSVSVVYCCGEEEELCVAAVGRRGLLLHCQCQEQTGQVGDDFSV